MEGKADPPPAAATTPPDVSAAVEEARRLGHAEGLAAGRAEADDEIAALRRRLEEVEARHAALLAERERLWSEELARRLSGMLDDGLRAIAARLEELLAVLLAPFVEDAVSERAVAEFAALLAALREEDAGLVFHVRGPAALLAALRRRLPGTALETAVDDASAELRVVLTDTVIETRLREWLSRLRDAAGDALPAAPPPAQAETAAPADDDGERT